MDFAADQQAHQSPRKSEDHNNEALVLIAASMQDAQCLCMIVFARPLNLTEFLVQNDDGNMRGCGKFKEASRGQPNSGSMSIALLTG